MNKNHNCIFQTFATRWNVQKDQVQYIFTLIERTGGKYGKSSRVLKGFGFIVTPRQLKYFYRKVKLHERLKISSKGKPSNYSKLLRSNT